MRLRLFTPIVVCLVFTPSLLQCQSASLGTDAPRLFEKGVDALSGVGGSRDEQGALDYFHRAAELSYAPAQTMLGYFYETGTIVSADPAQALDWYKKAAKENDRLGNWLVGRAYLNGGSMPRDPNAAEPFLQKAAALGDPYAQYLLGTIKLEHSDFAKAAELFRKSAMQGLPQAQQKFGELLEHGQGVAADKLQAYVWLTISYDAGNLNVVGDMQSLQGDLGVTQTDGAKNKARDLELTVTRAVVAKGCTGWPGEFEAIPAPPPPDIQPYCH